MPRSPTGASVRTRASGPTCTALRCPGTSPRAPEAHHQIFFAQRNYTFAHQNALFDYFFNLCPDPLILCPDPPNICQAIYVRKVSRARQLRGSMKTHWFRWKEIDVTVLLTIAVTLLPLRRQPMADNYRGRQSRTCGGAIYFT